MDKLNQYGHSFQIKVITSLLTDKSFIQQVSDILYPDFFESEANNWIVSEIQSYYAKFKSIPTLDVFKIKLQ